MEKIAAEEIYVRKWVATVKRIMECLKEKPPLFAAKKIDGIE